MTGPLAAVRDFFVAPPVHGRAATARPVPVPPSFAVLGERREAVAVASGLVLASGAGPGLVCVWPAGEVRPRLPATARARRAAARLEARGVTALAGGRLVGVPLPGPAAEAVAVCQRAAAALGIATAVALAGPRDDDLDALLALQDAVVLVTARVRGLPAGQAGGRRAGGDAGPGGDGACTVGSRLRARGRRGDRPARPSLRARTGALVPEDVARWPAAV